jgi:hypothetical protein
MEKKMPTAEMSLLKADTPCVGSSALGNKEK